MPRGRAPPEVPPEAWRPARMGQHSDEGAGFPEHEGLDGEEEHGAVDRRPQRRTKAVRWCPDALGGTGPNSRARRAPRSGACQKQGAEL